MTAAGTGVLPLEHVFASALPELGVAWRPEPVPAPHAAVVNDDLARDLGLDADALRTPEGLAVLSGNAVPAGAHPIAMAYAGHQFGHFQPILGDGRALLLGEIRTDTGQLRDLHLKGSGPTPFSRGGDGKAALGPMLREYILGEALHGLGIPTTRALAVVATGEFVRREEALPGAVLTRVAASHIRVGTFEYAATHQDRTVLERLAGHAIERHHPQAASAANPAAALLAAVAETQAALVAQWMCVGFIHGVMNTDNMAISGETIDFGPCAFMDRYDPATVYSSIDRGGRYAYGNQARIAQWNVARLAEALLPLIDANTDAAVATATEIVSGFATSFDRHRRAGLRAKLGLRHERAGDDQLAEDFLQLLLDHRVDYTGAFRFLADDLRARRTPADGPFPTAASIEPWLARWHERLAGQGDGDHRAVADAMDSVNPVYIPRNHLVEAALAAAQDGDQAPTDELVEALRSPHRARPGFERFAEPAPASFETGYRTFCGT